MDKQAVLVVILNAIRRFAIWCMGGRKIELGGPAAIPMRAQISSETELPLLASPIQKCSAPNSLKEKCQYCGSAEGFKVVKNDYIVHCVCVVCRTPIE